jgi:hypothetical protein
VLGKESRLKMQLTVLLKLRKELPSGTEGAQKVESACAECSHVIMQWQYSDHLAFSWLRNMDLI